MWRCVRRHHIGAQAIQAEYKEFHMLTYPYFSLL
jgi:hypothetical protein